LLKGIGLCNFLLITNLVSNPAFEYFLIEINQNLSKKAHSIPDGTVNQCSNQVGVITMLISGIVATTALVSVLVLLFVGSLALAAVDKHFDAGRIH
jgi:hypothetical protein